MKRLCLITVACALSACTSQAIIPDEDAAAINQAASSRRDGPYLEMDDEDSEDAVELNVQSSGSVTMP